MQVYFDIENLSMAVSKKPAVTLGTFDGVHLGHQAIIKRLVQRAKDSGKKSLVVTYSPHPQSVVAPESAPRILTTLEEKLYFLRKLNVDQVVVINFKKKLARQNARQFVEETLVGKLNVGDLIIGYDHAFGKNRQGKAELLNQMKSKYGFGLEIISPVQNTDLPIKSSRIREELKKGEFSKAIKMLGHSYPVWGTRVKGKGLGRNLGYPTINLKVQKMKLLPPDGVYAARAKIEDKTWMGMMYKGKKPTFGGKSPTLEIHLFNYEQLQNAEKICLFMEEWIREDMKFNSTEKLKDQLRQDEKTAKSYFFKKGG